MEYQTLVRNQVPNDAPNWREDAYLAQGAYNGSEVEGYTIDPELSNEYATTYINNKSKKATVAFSGTNFHDPGSWRSKVNHAAEDMGSDINIWEGNEEDDPHFQAAEELTRKAISKYGQKNTYATGHSLGGTKTAFVSHKTGIRGTSFNMGWSPKDYIAHTTSVDPLHGFKNHKWDMSKVDAYTVPGDPVAAGTFLQPGLRTHTINRTEKLNKLKSDLYGKGAVGGKAASTIASAHPVLKAGHTALSVWGLGNDFYNLHKSSNFIYSRPQNKPEIRQPSKVAPVPEKILPQEEEEHGHFGGKPHQDRFGFGGFL